MLLVIISASTVLDPGCPSFTRQNEAQFASVCSHQDHPKPGPHGRLHTTQNHLDPRACKMIWPLGLRFKVWGHYLTCFWGPGMSQAVVLRSIESCPILVIVGQKSNTLLMRSVYMTFSRCDDESQALQHRAALLDDTGGSTMKQISDASIRNISALPTGLYWQNIPSSLAALGLWKHLKAPRIWAGHAIGKELSREQRLVGTDCSRRFDRVL